MDKISIHSDLYSEVCRIHSELREIDKQRMKLEAKREALADCEMHLRCLMRDHGEFVYESYKPKEEEENA